MLENGNLSPSGSMAKGSTVKMKYLSMAVKGKNSLMLYRERIN